MLAQQQQSVNTRLTHRPRGQSAVQQSTIKETITPETKSDNTDYHIMLACTMHRLANHWHLSPASPHTEYPQS